MLQAPCWRMAIKGHALMLFLKPADESKAALDEVQASNARSKRKKDFC